MLQPSPCAYRATGSFSSYWMYFLAKRSNQWTVQEPITKQMRRRQSEKEEERMKTVSFTTYEKIDVPINKGTPIGYPNQWSQKGNPFLEPQKGSQNSSNWGPVRFHWCQIGPKLWTTSRDPKGHPNKWGHLGPQSRYHIPHPGTIPSIGVLYPNPGTLPPSRMYKTELLTNEQVNECRIGSSWSAD